jgi:DNA-binding transcriptional LysR family regulator
VIDLRRLQVLRAVAHYGTVTAAAQSLYVTPSAASQQIRQLGRQLGITLLEPHGRRVRLTSAARSLLIHADAIEERWQRAEADLAAGDPRQAVAGELRLCGIPSAVSTLLAPAAAQLRHTHPRLTVSIREAEPPDCFDLVFSGGADLAITMAAPDGLPLTDPRFDQQRLLDDPYDLLTAPDHPLAGRTDLSLAACAAEPWILSMPHTTYRHMVLAICNTAGFTPSIAHEALEWTAVATLVGHGLGISLIHRLAQLPAHPAVVRTPLASGSTPRRRLLTVTRRGSHTSPAITAAYEHLTTIAATYETGATE